MFWINIGILMLVVIGLCLQLQDSQRWRRYLEAHPPLTDDEYLAKFDSDVDPKICLKVRELVSDKYGVEKEVIYPDTRFVGDLD